MLSSGGISLFIYNAERAPQTSPGLMHNKFFLFEENILSRSVVWTGSFNVTAAAGKSNRENVIVSEEKLYIDKYSKEFEQLKKYCDVYQIPRAAVPSERDKNNSGMLEKK